MAKTRHPPVTGAAELTSAASQPRPSARAGTTGCVAVPLGVTGAHLGEIDINKSGIDIVRINPLIRLGVEADPAHPVLKAAVSLAPIEEAVDDELIGRELLVDGSSGVAEPLLTGSAEDLGSGNGLEDLELVHGDRAAIDRAVLGAEPVDVRHVSLRDDHEGASVDGLELGRALVRVKQHHNSVR